jgi:hypothetical protein
MVLETKYGDFVITGTRLRTVLDTEIMLNEMAITSLDKDKFYVITGSAPSSHGPIDKLNDMVRFGLLTKTNQNFTITPLGYEFLNSSEQERSKVVDKIIRNIPLWNTLLDMIGENPNLEAFSNTIREITQASPEIINRNLTRLHSAYLGDVECIHKKPPYGKPSPLTGRTRSAPKGEWFYPEKKGYKGIHPSDDIPPNPSIEMSIRYGDHNVIIKDELSYRFAEQVMMMIRKELVRRGIQISG